MVRRPKELEEELEVEKKRKTEELEELGKAMEKEYEDRVRKALAQLRWHHDPRHFLQGGP